jgi:tetratricopeptide (TPR) repeat protein
MYGVKSRCKLLSAVLCVTVLWCWVALRADAFDIKVPPLAPLDPIYKLPTISLARKAKVLFRAIKRRHLNNQGYLLYQSYLPFSHEVDDTNYQLSHNSADLPAWHGHWMAALAMRLAVAPSRKAKSLLHKAVVGLRTNFVATGITGLLARAYLEYDGDEPLPWMATKDRKPTRFWQKGENGFWFRNGVAKDHYCQAVFGLGTVIGLENRGAITLDPKTSMLVRQTLVEIAHYLIDNDYRIIDATGDVTEFGRLDDWPVNGFDGLQLLAMLRAGKAIGDRKCAREYWKLVLLGASNVIASTLGGLGDFYARIGRENAFGHYSDDQAIYTNAFTLFFNSGKRDQEVLRDVEFALEKFWQFLRYSRKSYMTFIQAAMSGVSQEEREQALETLRLFPDDKRVISNLEFEDTHSVQPIPNQKINSHYWKTDYFRKAILTDASERIDVEYSGQDYLFVYWMGRYFGLISEEEANAEVVWDDQ